MKREKQEFFISCDYIGCVEWAGVVFFPPFQAGVGFFTFQAEVIHVITLVV